MNAPAALKPWSLLVGLMVTAAGVISLVVLFNSDPYGERQTVEPIPPIDQSLIGYHETRKLATGLDAVHALAVGDDCLAVGGDRCVKVFDLISLTERRRIDLDGAPRCLAVSGARHVEPGRIYVGLDDHIEVFDAEGQPLGAWPKPADRARLTAVAAGDDDVVVVADSINRLVWHYDASGHLVGQIGDCPDFRDTTQSGGTKMGLSPSARKNPGFIITDRNHFDLTIGPDGLVYVVNPRLLRIEAYTLDGDLRSHWGHGSTELDGFYGCCNPADIAALADGRFVTLEKGIIRIKLYSAMGKLLTVVAGPQHFAELPSDIAVDARGRVFVLDAREKTVRVFEPK